MHGSIAGIRKFVQIPILALLAVCTFFLQADQLDPENTEPRSAHSANFTGSANLLDIATVEISAPASTVPASTVPESTVPESTVPESTVPESAALNPLLLKSLSLNPLSLKSPPPKKWQTISWITSPG